MHTYVLVIGDNPVERATDLSLPLGTTDWAGIGGRYSGALPTLPQATTGVVFGDTLPAAEAHLAAMLAETGHDVQRMRPDPMPGVDQLRRRDLDVHAVPSPAYLLDENDVVHEPGLTPEERATGIAIRYAQQIGIPHLVEPDEDVLDQIEAKGEAWDRRVQEILTALPDDALLTVIDAHV